MTLIIALFYYNDNASNFIRIDMKRNNTKKIFS